jgi:asparagine synthase (glutamine-hydrolysing)
MCGFAGFTGYLENGEEVLTNMMNKIIHRGPDSAGRESIYGLSTSFYYRPR